MRLFRAIIKRAKEKNIELILFISPLHAWALESFEFFGYWEKFEQWKRDLVKEVEPFNKISPQKKKTILWDFNYYNAYTTESVPPAGDSKTIMKWHIDPGHYSDTLGDIILDTILLKKNHNAGILITSQNIEEHIKSIRKTKESFQTQNDFFIKKPQKKNDSVITQKPGGVNCN
mgnify:CR=1 FL=1